MAGEMRGGCSRISPPEVPGGSSGLRKRSPMSTHMIPRERCEFSAIVDRPPLKLPGGARLVLWSIVNYEV